MPLNSGAISARISNISFFNKYYHMWLEMRGRIYKPLFLCVWRAMASGLILIYLYIHIYIYAFVPLLRVTRASVVQLI